MAKSRMYGYFKPVTPNNRAWCPKRKVNTSQRNQGSGKGMQKSGGRK